VAQRALPPGSYRRRSVFGLFDADGWTLATLKSLFWFAVILFLLGYLPDRAYYFTVLPAIDVGANFVSPVNFCPGSNKTLACPAPAGAVVPWESSPSEIAMPAGRSNARAFASGTNLYVIGGTVGGAASAEVLVSQASVTGNFGRWTQAPPLPQPRSGAAVASLGGVPHVIGGLDASGKPTDTVFAGELKEGALTGWTELPDLKLPKPLSGASAVGTATGFWLFGGKTAEGPTAAVLRSVLDGATPPKLGAWEEVANLPLPEPRAGATALLAGEFVYIVGGEGPGGPATELFRLQLDTEGEPTSPKTATGEAGPPPAWAITRGAAAGQSLPEPRLDAAAWASSGVIYVAGGRDAAGEPTRTLYWAVPRTATGDIPEWRHRDDTDLPEARAGAAPVVVGSFAFVIGGDGPNGATTGAYRANQAPAPPFFRLGLLGATLPALGIKGEIGQQLGYINAFGLGLTNFTILVLVGVAFSHRRETQRIIERVSRGRYRAPREDEYFEG
jgi:hypothetical protein